MSVLTPYDVIARLLRLTASGPCEEMADLFAEDAVFEFPFQLPGRPREEQDRETFRAHLRAGARLQRFESVDDVEIHRTTDPETVIAEYRLQGRVTATGKQFTSQVVMVARVRDGLITWSRNYSNPLDSLIAFGMVDDLVAGLTAGTR
ncbi:nuclear transport factor 2 family protein [Microbispora catharanthi]|uniref:Nuclear transport factor 2 family protein n=1 Tax=Microbispora catharanthi TaxID=1712871 RepID=A0A5N6BL68_9ACTN|nr:nuclear transport factor 2 family protein [Microbispora catharanthi]KAB8181232.1 nuclear transport factor 2 family protein [Microbispora catharanthi]